MTNDQETIVRLVASPDEDAWKKLYEGYRDFYRLAPDAQAVQLTWDWVLNGAHQLRGLVAVDAAGELIGLANIRTFARPSSAGIGVYLDDLFTAPDRRGHGIATALLRSVAEFAYDSGANIVRWITAEDNSVARSVYDANAAKTPWVTYDMQPAAK